MAKDGVHTGHRERLRNRIRNEGVMGLEPHEVLEALLYPCIPLKDTNPIAHSLIKAFGTLDAVLLAPESELAAIPNMTASAAFNLSLYGGLLKYAAVAKSKEKIHLKNEADTYDYLKAFFMNSAHELCYLVSLDINFRLIGADLISTGGGSYVNVDISKIVEAARRRGASKVILAHSHPAGALKASPEDTDLTEKAVIALGICNIHLVDHYIITDAGYTNFTSRYPLPGGINFIESVLSYNSHLFSQGFISEDTNLQNILALKEKKQSKNSNSR